jgi:hypothetical protein
MKITKAQKDELLAKAAAVLEEVVNEYEALEKMEVEEIADPTRKAEEDPKEEAAAMPEASEEEKEESADEDKKDDKDEDKKEDKEEEAAEEESEEALKSEYAALTAKMEARGFLKKEEPKAEKTEEVKKSETAQPAEDLRKAIDDRFETLTKSIQAIAEKVEKIASKPQARKGVAGYQPLKKNEEAPALNKSEAIGKLLDLKKSGDKRVTTDLIMRLETNRETQNDIEFVKGIVG